MSVSSEIGASGLQTFGASAGTAGPLSKKLHRIKEVRHEQGVSMRRAALHLGSDVRMLRREEDESTDLTLSRLYQWQALLEVPIGDLLVDSNAPLSAPVLERARMVRLMKTVAAIVEKSDNASVQRLAQTLVDQLVEIMPELKDVHPWHSVGQRRSLDEYGRIAERSFSDDCWRDR